MTRQVAPSIALLAAGLVLLAGRGSAPATRKTQAWAQPPPLSAQAIIERLNQENRRRDALLAGYTVERHYHLENEVLENDSDLRVRVSFESPDTLEFHVLSEEGSGFIARRVWDRILEAEKESLQPERKRQSALSPRNYTFELQGEEVVDGRWAYVLGVTPKREDTLLFNGKVWVDEHDFALARAEGRPAKMPSFWTQDITFTRQYKKVGPFWFPERTEGTIEVFLMGTTWVTVVHGDYRVKLQTGDAGAAPPRNS